MGVRAYFYRLSEEKMKSIRNDKKKIIKYINTQNNLRDNQNELFICKAWEGIHYLIYKEKWYGNYNLERGTLLNGESVYGSSDRKYGTLLLQYQDEVKKISEYINSYSKENMIREYDPKKFSQLEIYPFDEKWEDNAEDNRIFLIDYYEDLCAFYKKAVSNNEVILVEWKC
ncbi:MAG: DUF1877 family protein [Candidatus Heimdallarchaeota archaeon]